MAQEQHLEAFGDEDIDHDADSDFAGEHQDTTVDPDIRAKKDDRETESPDGWSGQDQDGPP